MNAADAIYPGVYIYLSFQIYPEPMQWGIYADQVSASCWKLLNSGRFLSIKMFIDVCVTDVSDETLDNLFYVDKKPNTFQ